MADQTLTCRNAERCAAKDTNGNPYPTSDPLCWTCLDRAGRDIRNLTFDYLDLAQLHAPSMSQAIAERASGSKEKPIPIKTHVEALQAEILHVLSTWEYEVRVAARLSDPYVPAPVADWHTTITKPTPLAKVRPGAAVQRAVAIVGQRVELLSKLPATTVCPTGGEDTPALVEGWQAVLQLADLHGRAKGMLGRTTRQFWIPGDCWNCEARDLRDQDGPLFRSEPKRFEDPMEVHCSRCSAVRSYADYEHLQAHLEWPDLDQAAA